MNCSTIAAGAELSWMNCTRLRELLVVLDDRRLRDAGRRLEEQRLHDQRERAACFGSAGLRPQPDDGEVGHRNAVVGEQLLRQRLVAREDQAARIAAGIGEAAAARDS